MKTKFQDKLRLLYHKWFLADCPHFCRFCEFKDRCETYDMLKN